MDLHPTFLVTTRKRSFKCPCRFTSHFLNFEWKKQLMPPRSVLSQRYDRTSNKQHLLVISTMRNTCTTCWWIRLFSWTVVSIAIEHVYQQDNCGFNELILVVVAHVFVEKQVCRVGPSFFILFFWQKHFIFNDRCNTLSISISWPFPFGILLFILFDIDLVWVKLGETEKSRWISHGVGTTGAVAWKKLSWWILTFRG